MLSTKIRIIFQSDKENRRKGTKILAAMSCVIRGDKRPLPVKLDVFLSVLDVNAPETFR